MFLRIGLRIDSRIVLHRLLPPFARLLIGSALIVVFAVLAVFAVSTASGARLDFGEGRDMDIFFMVQFWDVTTFGAKGDAGQDIDDRNDLFIRRGRFGVKGHFRHDIRYNFNFAYDGVGLDLFTASTGTPQEIRNQAFFLWDAFVTLALNRQWANLTVGYFRPQVGRESITTAFAVNSFVKALPNIYPRLHIVGRGPGRETGLELGGLHRWEGGSLNYNVGAFDTNHRRIVGTAGGGSNWAPLWVARVAVSLGDPEMPEYGLGYRVNYFGARHGVTLAVNGTTQGRTNQTAVDSMYAGGFDSNSMLGCDLLVNYGGLNLGAEYDLMYRRFCERFPPTTTDLTGSEYTDRVWFVRAGYNFPLRTGQIIEPVVLFSRFEGDETSAFFPNGVHEVLDVGVNWYLDENRLKVNLHYIAQSGSPVSFYSSGHDALGDYLGIGLQLVF